MKNKRSNLLFLIFFVGIGILWGRMFFLQIIKWKDYRIEVQDLNTKILKENPKRGNIYDRNGKLLAWNEKNYQIINMMEDIDLKKEKEIRSILSKSEFDIDKVIDKLNFQKKIMLNISSTTAKKFSLIEGFVIIEKIIRKYAHPSLFHILGYVDNEGTARSGLEKVKDDILKGKLGYKIVSLTPSGNIKNIIESSPAIPGEDVYLTIDLDIQKSAYSEFEKINIPGSTIVSDIYTGEIVAMVSYPAPNPNDFSIGISNLEYSRILNDTNKPLINRSIYALYAPGSVIKPFFAYSAMEKGISPEATVNSVGKYNLYNSKNQKIATFYDWNYLGHGETNLVKSLRVSANTYYYWLGEQLGIDYAYKMSKEYNITGLTGIDIPGEKEGLFPSKDWKVLRYGINWYPGDTTLAFIGQGYVLNTPIEILKYYNILATEGKYFQFHIFKNQEDLFGNKINEYKINNKESYEMNNEYLRYIKQGLEEAVNYRGNSEYDTKNGGTAYSAFKGFKVKVAGKTGTAEVSGGKKSHAWFAGYLPSDSPKYSIVTFIENGGFGSHVAAPVARKTLELLVEKYF